LDFYGLLQPTALQFIAPAVLILQIMEPTMPHNGMFTIPIDRDSEEPIYRQLIRQIRAQIESGSLAAGTRLPASRDLARQLNISRISVSMRMLSCGLKGS
jgi:transcriptional regulator, GntR family